MSCIKENFFVSLFGGGRPLLSTRYSQMIGDCFSSTKFLHLFIYLAKISFFLICCKTTYFIIFLECYWWIYLYIYIFFFFNSNVCLNNFSVSLSSLASIMIVSDFFFVRIEKIFNFTGERKKYFNYRVITILSNKGGKLTFFFTLSIENRHLTASLNTYNTTSTKISKKNYKIQSTVIIT